MAVTGMAKIASLSVGAILLGLSIPYLPNLSSPRLVSFIGDFPMPDYPFAFPFFKNHTQPPAESPFVCDAMHTYRTELVSLEPLIIYIHNLITPTEIASLLETAEPKFAPSQVNKFGRQQQTSDRTSSSAGLPRDDPTVACVLDRARNFMGTMLRDGWDEMGPPQLVRYTSGQRFNVHHDWFDYPQWAKDGQRKWNRVASFFSILQDNCTGGETHFPHAKPIAPPSPRGEPVWQGGADDKTQKDGAEAKPLWREHEDGGLAFRPVAGNAIFWVNLHPNGTGDWRTNHAGLPLERGLKTAMNIWPRHYYPYS
ncbi:Prolyl 4-hydroxylase alpha subunit domain-containing protein [Madurella fahalii]|uniref:Prolyl 4-hydroxylase alpha subunit domain-containing protein n=1 Tax=Madurella fahalii TaxID=1157608 RepID=A0ABQ0FYR0_9PEZI